MQGGGDHQQIAAQAPGSADARPTGARATPSVAITTPIDLHHEASLPSARPTIVSSGSVDKASAPAPLS
jgi:hypothetical protein